MRVALRAALGGVLLTMLLVACSVLPSPGSSPSPTPAAGSSPAAATNDAAPVREGARAPDGPLPTVRVAPTSTSPPRRCPTSGRWQRRPDSRT